MKTSHLNNAAGADAPVLRVSLERARTLLMFRALPLLSLALLAVHVDAQDLTISVDVRLVVLHASVRDRKGVPVTGLQAANFRIEEDGEPQRVRVFPPESVPVVAGLVIDNSGSMGQKQAQVLGTAAAFVRSSSQGSEMFIVNFNENVSLGLPAAKPFSESVAELESVLQQRIPTGKTALFDAIHSALAQIQKSARERKVLVVISDGGDNASKHSLTQILDEIGRYDVTIYTIRLLDEDDTDRNPRVLRQIAAVSGGKAFVLHNAADAVRICGTIAKDIPTQYTLVYSPTNQDSRGQFRAVKVSAISAHGAKLQVQTRTGYFTSPKVKQ